MERPGDRAAEGAVHEQLPVLRQAFEGADANLRLSTALQKYGLQLDHFVGLLEVILMSD